ncbi:DUF4062 domain-containing protein [Paraburkholderia sediminicola]|uniref:DUF4062 domain-containing protein n=1 Tax=Paraburkholderia sediminicola TaxID=458836 RepID=UPI0038B6C610
MQRTRNQNQTANNPIMPRISTIVQVFLASPSDVQPEREALEGLISEMNRTWSTTLGIMFELVRWETHVIPAIGNDPQAVINEQIGDNYDVFIGILWARFGTPTPRAASGTMEEFERAYARLQTERDGPAVMFYFKEAAVPISKIDPEQLSQVQKFRAALPASGGVYSTFDDLAGFNASVRAHLSSLAQKFSRANMHPKSAAQSPETEALKSLAADEHDLGLLDYAEISEARIDDMVATMEVISEATARVGGQFEAHTRDMNNLSTAGVTPQSARRLIKRCADDMDAFAGILKNQIPILASNREAAFDALNNSLALAQEFDTSDNSSLHGLQQAMLQLRDNIEIPKQSLTQFRESTATLPRMTSDLNKAKRAVVQQIDALIQEFDKTDSTASNVLLSIGQILSA